MDLKHENNAFAEKVGHDGSPYGDPEHQPDVAIGQNQLHRDLKGRHMQMIAM